MPASSPSLWKRAVAAEHETERPRACVCACACACQLACVRACGGGGDGGQSRRQRGHCASLAQAQARLTAPKSRHGKVGHGKDTAHAARIVPKRGHERIERTRARTVPKRRHGRMYMRYFSKSPGAAAPASANRSLTPYPKQKRAARAAQGLGARQACGTTGTHGHGQATQGEGARGQQRVRRWRAAAGRRPPRWRAHAHDLHQTDTHTYTHRHTLTRARSTKRRAIRQHGAYAGVPRLLPRWRRGCKHRQQRSN